MNQCARHLWVQAQGFPGSDTEERMAMSRLFRGMFCASLNRVVWLYVDG